MSYALTPITQAERALAEAASIDDLKDVRAFASAMQKGARARGMGIEAENQAAELVLRAERRIGQALRDMLENGERAKGGGKPVLDALSIAAGRAQGALRGTTKSELPTLADLGLTNSRQAWEWQQLALLDEDTFERMLSEAKHLKERIAKVNFYRVKAKAKDESAGKTKEDSGFLQLRAGAYALLGWQVDATGEGGPTTNGLLALPNDELLAVANIIRALADAYNEVRKVR